MAYLSTPLSIHCMTRCSFFFPPPFALLGVSFYSRQPATGCWPFLSYPFLLRDLVKAQVVKAVPTTHIDQCKRPHLSLLPPCLRCPPPPIGPAPSSPSQATASSLSLSRCLRRGGGAQGSPLRPKATGGVMEGLSTILFGVFPVSSKWPWRRRGRRRSGGRA
jgi:hypothetical protein